MHDSKIYRLLSFDKKVRGFYLDSTMLCNYAKVIHGDNIPSITLLANCLSMALIMGQTLKSNKDNLTLQIHGDGPLKHLIATGCNNGTTRGYCSYPNSDFSYLENNRISLKKCLGNSYLTVIKDMGLKEPFNSTIKIENQKTLSEVFMDYYKESEQIETLIDFYIDLNENEMINYSGMIFIQFLPFTDKELEDRVKKEFKEKYNLEKIYKGKEYLKDFLEDDFNITETKECLFKCNCSFERGLKVLSTLSIDELKNMILSNEITEVTCDFCNKKYKYTKEDLEKVLEIKKKTSK